MSGVYIHIPFCAQKCSYCDFHFSTDTRYVERMLQCMHVELATRLSQSEIKTCSSIYFGGGTPSLLPAQAINRFIADVHKRLVVPSDLEVTLEANPEDINPTVLREWIAAGVNRLSMGIQSFHEPVLRKMNRIHSATQANKAVKQSQDAGIGNISVDFIYGHPWLDYAGFLKDLEAFIALDTPHLSAYTLTIEPGTLLHRQQAKGDFQALGDEEVSHQFLNLRSKLYTSGLTPYEVSNFSKTGMESRHNSSYWAGKPYVGIGPSAHSYDGASTRRWNLSNNHKYMQAIESGEVYFEEEHINQMTSYNEHILTGLRTAKGIDLAHIRERYNVDIITRYAGVLERYKALLTLEGHRLTLKELGYLQADGIAADLFQIED